MHKYKIKRNHKQKLRYKFQFIHKNSTFLNNLAHLYTNPRIRLRKNSVQKVTHPTDNLPIFTKNKNHVRQFHIP